MVFENFDDKMNGVSDKITETKLKGLLGDSRDKGIKLAFVSACHSERIGEILHECGIPVVVAVNSDSTIDDNVCLLFSRTFYK